MKLKCNPKKEQELLKVVKNRQPGIQSENGKLLPKNLKQWQKRKEKPDCQIPPKSYEVLFDLCVDTCESLKYEGKHKVGILVGAGG